MRGRPVTWWRTLRVVASLASALSVALLLATARPASANLCANIRQGDVIFIGEVVEAPPRGGPFDDVMGVYRFEVREVLVGDPGDGRLWNPQGYGGGGVDFRLGGVYEVHAVPMVPRADTSWAELTTNTCLANRAINPGNEIGLRHEIVGWARSLMPAPFLIMIGIALLPVVLAIFSRSRRRARRRARVDGRGDERHFAGG